MGQRELWQRIDAPLEGEAISFPLDVCTSFKNQLGEQQQLTMKEGGFTVCMAGKYYAYRNHCPHVGTPLDWLPNQFFSEDGAMLLCHTHGALFEPTTGECMAGPCPRGLYPLGLKMLDDELWVVKSISL